MSELSFNKKDKIKGIKPIQALFNEPNTVIVFPFKAFYQFNSNTKYSDNLTLKIAVSVAKRRFKKAPERNRIKRLMREAYRLNQHRLKAKLIPESDLSVMIVYIGNDLPVLNKLNKKTIELFDQIIQQIEVNLK